MCNALLVPYLLGVMQDPTRPYYPMALWGRVNLSESRAQIFLHFDWSKFETVPQKYRTLPVDKPLNLLDPARALSEDSRRNEHTKWSSNQDILRSGVVL